MNDLSTNVQPVMSSREIATLTGKRHDNVLADIRRMLGELYDAEGVLKFQGTYIHPQNGQEYIEYQLDEDHTLNLISGYDAKLRMAVIKRWRELETGKAIPANSLAATTAMLEISAKLLNVSESGKVVMLRKAGESLGADMGFLPAYTVDAAPGREGSSMETYSLSHLLREFGLRVPASQVNVMLEKAGILSQKFRKGSKGQPRAFWNITSKGLAYGKNITSPQSPRETQPHWYRETFSSLLAVVGLERAA